MNFSNYFSNTFWLLASKIYRMGFALAVTVWMARYLGPEEFGLLNYALSFVIIFSVLISLGLENVVVKQVINDFESEGEVVASSLILRFIGGAIFFLTTILVVFIIKPDGFLLHQLVVILSFGYLFKSFEILRYWFEAHVKAKYSALMEVVALTVSASLKVVLILVEAPLYLFAWAVVSEFIVMAFGLSIMFSIHYKKPFVSLKPNIDRIKYLFKEAWPLTLAGALYMIATKVDQIMLGNMVGSEAVGVYAAAVKLSEGWFFIPAVIATSLYPTMLHAKNNSRELYLERTQHLLNIMAAIGISAAVGIGLIASPLMSFVFGDEYTESAAILIVHIWGGVFIAISGISYRYLIAEGLQKYSLYRGITGAIVNIAMNYLFIPTYGAMGAAVSTVVSQFMALYLFNCSRFKTRELFYMQSKALSLVGLPNTLRQINAIVRKR